MVTVGVGKLLLRSFFLGVLFCRVSSGSENVDAFVSQESLRKLAVTERKIAKNIAEYVKGLETRLEMAKRLLDDFKNSGFTYNVSTEITHKNDRNGDHNSVVELTANPLRAYRMIRRYVRDMPTLKRQLLMRQEEKLLKLLDNLKKQIDVPTDKDLKGASEGILRLHDTYNMDINDFTSGNFLGLRTNISLNAADCLHLGTFALDSLIFTRSIQWLERAYDLVLFHGDTSVSKSIVSRQLQDAIDKHNEAMNKPTKNYLFTKPVSMKNSLSTEEKTVGRVRVLETHKHVLFNKKNEIGDLLNFAALCRGKQLRPDQKLLKCWFETRQPTNRLMPLKVERLNGSPLLLQFHDIIPDKLISRALEGAASSQGRAMVHATSEVNYRTAMSSRVSTAAWLDDNYDGDFVEFDKIYKRVEEFTGIKIIGKDEPYEFAEEIQVSCYGIGGHFSPHMDTISKVLDLPQVPQSQKTRGDRLATLMFYLSDVERGGGTSFPRIGVTVKPKKGSAIFWYNLDHNGNPNVLTLHGGCPTLYGHKCVANKWVRYNSQSCPSTG